MRFLLLVDYYEMVLRVVVAATPGVIHLLLSHVDMPGMVLNSPDRSQSGGQQSDSRKA